MLTNRREQVTGSLGLIYFSFKAEKTFIGQTNIYFGGLMDIQFFCFFVLGKMSTLNTLFPFYESERNLFLKCIILIE